MKRNIRKVVLAAAVLAGASFGVASSFGLGGGNGAAVAAEMGKKGDIIQVATGPGMATVTTLVKAVKAAGLVDALKGPGPFTVFAPTNDAFAKLPPEVLSDLLKPENKEKLTKILLYHVHAGEAVASADLKDGKVTTLNGKDLDVKIDGPTIVVNGATVTKTDVQASNGVIHWIDTVIVPAE
jgi:transforming growth factor-beta-induced protein